MKKIPTLFERIYDDNGKIIGISDTVKEGFEWVLNGEGIATLKVDGSCCAVINGELYKRYDAKRGKKPPEGAIPCQEAPDPITTHWPHWVKLSRDNPADKWFIRAFHDMTWPDGTYEAIGPHFQGNPYGLDEDTIYRHGTKFLPDFPRDFEGMKKYFELNVIEGIVFWKDCEPKCKIKRSDFGFEWNKGVNYGK